MAALEKLHYKKEILPQRLSSPEPRQPLSGLWRKCILFNLCGLYQFQRTCYCSVPHPMKCFYVESSHWLITENSEMQLHLAQKASIALRSTGACFRQTLSIQMHTASTGKHCFISLGLYSTSSDEFLTHTHTQIYLLHFLTFPHKGHISMPYLWDKYYYFFLFFNKELFSWCFVYKRNTGMLSTFETWSLFPNNNGIF